MRLVVLIGEMMCVWVGAVCGYCECVGWYCVGRDSCRGYVGMLWVCFVVLCVEMMGGKDGAV